MAEDGMAEDGMAEDGAGQGDGGQHGARQGGVRHDGVADGGVADGGGLRRPVGWWVKEVDRLLDAAFDRALTGAGATRREWQMLSSLAAGPVAAEELLRSLGPFGEPEQLAADLDHLVGRDLVDRSAGTLTLAPAGEARLAALQPAIAGVRRLVADSLPGDDYAALVAMLARLAQGLTAGGAQR